MHKLIIGTNLAVLYFVILLSLINGLCIQSLTFANLTDLTVSFSRHLYFVMSVLLGKSVPRSLSSIILHGKKSWSFELELV